jgi:hypothetical protein
VIRKNIDLPEWVSNQLARLLDDTELANMVMVEEARLVALQKARNGDTRSPEQITKAFVKGWVLEEVVRQWLESEGYEVLRAPSNEKWYDMIVNGHKVDIKGVWNQSRSFTQTPWEREKLAYNGDKVTYLCFEIDVDADHFIIFKGAAAHTDMRDSFSGNGSGFVMTNQLKDFKP